MMKKSNKMKTHSLFRHSLKTCLPAGISVYNEFGFYLLGVALSFCYGIFRFSIRFSSAKDALYTDENPHRLLPYAVMEDFPSIGRHCLAAFLLLAFAVIPWVIYHYNYHFKESKSIYLMKRLPQNGEFLKRCITLPLLSLVFTAVTALITTLLLFGLYWILTPDAALPEHQWQLLCKNWRILL